MIPLKEIQHWITTPRGMASAALCASPLLLEAIAPIGPRWPGGASSAALSALWIAGVLFAASAVSGYVAALRSGRRGLLVLLMLALVATVLSGWSYVKLDSSVCWTVPSNDPGGGRTFRHRIIGGSEADATEVARQLAKAGLTIPMQLRENAYTTDNIWTPDTVARSGRQLVGLWIGFCSAVAVAGGAALRLLSTEPPPVLTAGPYVVVPKPGDAPMPLMPGVQFEEYWKALNAAYDQDSLDRMLRFRLDRQLNHLVGDGPLPDMTYQLLKEAEREGWHVDLIRAAHQFNPRNAALAAVYEKYGLSPEISVQQNGAALEAAGKSVSASGFERTVKEHLPMFDIVTFREGLTQVEGWTCRIESNGNAVGSGFLVGPDLVITNYHVMNRVIQDPTLSTKIRCRFDYKVLSDGSRQMGVDVPLHATTWNVCSSKYTADEERGRPDASLPTIDELDYALIRLADAVGGQPIPPQGAGAPPRGWLKLPAVLDDLVPPVPLIIAQHPDGAPLKLAMDTDGIKSVNQNKTRVRYDTTTESGSSGSPCFRFDWIPVALHHYGDPGTRFHNPQFNQGIPFAMIRDHLGRNGHAGVL